MLIEEFIKVLELSWSKDTCTPSLQDIWNENNKAIGQCAVTALIVNDFFGGKIMRCMCESGSHYYNLINNNIVDLTSSQFTELPYYDKGEERTREYLLSNNDTRERYLLLLKLVKNNFIEYNLKGYQLLGINEISNIPKTLKEIQEYKKLK